jgi:hypothetical protein
VTPLPADHVNATDEPDNSVPGAGLIIAPGAVGVGVASAAPVPLRLTVGLPELALLVSVRLPVAVPTAVGANCTLILYVPPAATVTGMVFCATENCPVTLTCEICTDVTLSFLSETLAVAVCPRGTDPNESVFVEATRDPLTAAFALPAMVPHPDKATAMQPAATASSPAHHTWCLRSREIPDWQARSV